MKRYLNILTTCCITTMVHGQCDVKLSEQAKQIAASDSVTILKDFYVDLEKTAGNSPSEFKFTFVLQKDVEYRLYLLSSDKYDGTGKVQIEKANKIQPMDGSLVSKKIFEYDTTIVLIQQKQPRTKQPNIDFKVAKTSVYSIKVSQTKGNRLCALGIIAATDKNYNKTIINNRLVYKQPQRCHNLKQPIRMD